MADVFISYARDDGAVAARLKQRLSALGLSVFYDVDGGIDAGDTFPERISNAVIGSKAVLACWTPHSLTRPWVRRECMIARELSKLVPVAMAPLSALDLKEFIDTSYEDIVDFHDQETHLGWSRTLSAIAKKMVAWAEEHAADPDASAANARASVLQQAALAARKGLSENAPRQTVGSEMSRLWGDLQYSTEPGRLIRFADSFPGTSEAFAARERAKMLQDEIKAERDLDKHSLQAVQAFIAQWPHHHNLLAIQSLVPELEVADREHRKIQSERQARERENEARLQRDQARQEGAERARRTHGIVNTWLVRIANFTAPPAIAWFGWTWALRAWGGDSYEVRAAFPDGITIPSYWTYVSNHVDGADGETTVAVLFVASMAGLYWAVTRITSAAGYGLWSTIVAATLVVSSLTLASVATFTNIATEPGVARLVEPYDARAQPRPTNDASGAPPANDTVNDAELGVAEQEGDGSPILDDGALRPVTVDGAYDVSTLHRRVRVAALEAREAEVRAEAAAVLAQRAAERATDAAVRARNGDGGYRAFDYPRDPNGGHYEGGWSASDEAHGFGVASASSGPGAGNRYLGEWSDGQYGRYGIYYFADNEQNTLGLLRYEGEWADIASRGVYHGAGVRIWRNGDRRAGVERNGRMSGEGVLRFANGERYEGDWENGQRRGLGVLWDAQGRVIQAGRWSDGALVEPLSH